MDQKNSKNWILSMFANVWNMERLMPYQICAIKLLSPQRAGFNLYTRKNFWIRRSDRIFICEVNLDVMFQYSQLRPYWTLTWIVSRIMEFHLQCCAKPHVFSGRCLLKWSYLHRCPQLYFIGSDLHEILVDCKFISDDQNFEFKWSFIYYGLWKLHISDNIEFHSFGHSLHLLTVLYCGRMIAERTSQDGIY